MMRYIYPTFTPHSRSSDCVTVKLIRSGINLDAYVQQCIYCIYCSWVIPIKSHLFYLYKAFCFGAEHEIIILKTYAIVRRQLPLLNSIYHLMQLNTEIIPNNSFKFNNCATGCPSCCFNFICTPLTHLRS